MPSTPQSPRKRQQKLTTFFTSTSSSGTGTGTLLNKTIHLAPEIQSGLLSVGMRVRKSVPEGYKSGTYAHNKHLEHDKVPGSSQESNTSDMGVRKRNFDEEEVEEGEKEDPATTMTQGISGRVYKMPVSKRVHHKTVARRDVVQMPQPQDDFDEAGFLRPVDDDNDMEQ